MKIKGNMTVRIIIALIAGIAIGSFFIYIRMQAGLSGSINMSLM